MFRSSYFITIFYQSYSVFGKNLVRWNHCFCTVILKVMSVAIISVRHWEQEQGQESSDSNGPFDSVSAVKYYKKQTTKKQSCLMSIKKKPLLSIFPINLIGVFLFLFISFDWNIDKITISKYYRLNDGNNSNKNLRLRQKKTIKKSTFYKKVKLSQQLNWLETEQTSTATK